MEGVPALAPLVLAPLEGVAKQSISAFAPMEGVPALAPLVLAPLEGVLPADPSTGLFPFS